MLAPSSRPQVFKNPVMIMGADVSHAAPESKVGFIRGVYFAGSPPPGGIMFLINGGKKL